MSVTGNSTQHRTICSCPVHKDGSPPTLPLGVPFSDRVSIESIPAHTASAIYESHHSYLPETPTVNLVHHGVLLDNHLVGAITYRQPLISKMGDYDGSEITEAARICIAVDMPNLASAAFSKSHDRFEERYASKHGIGVLITFVRDDHSGSMIQALRDKGWEYGGTVEAAQAGNREHKEIREHDKEKWVYRIKEPKTRHQATLSSQIS